MRTRRERIIHSILFEVLAITAVAPAFSLITRTPLVDTGLLSLLLSAGALVINYAWTRVFDGLAPTRRRGVVLRFAHAIGFELLIACYTLPLVMLFTATTLRQAFLLDLGALCFFAIFGVAYNWVFDAVMSRLAPVSS